MKRNMLLTMMLCLMAITVSAQIHITPEAGVTMLKKENLKATVSPRIGVGLDFLFKGDKGLGLSTGLYFYQRKEAGRDGVVYMQNGEVYPLFFPYSSFITDAGAAKFIFSESDVKRNYLHLPLLMTYTWKFTENWGLSLGVGPYVAYGISGNYALSQKEYDVKSGHFSFSDKEFSPFDVLAYHRCDVGISSMVSMNLNQWLVKMSFETNLNRRDVCEDNLISLGIGYRFSL